MDFGDMVVQDFGAGEQFVTNLAASGGSFGLLALFW